MATVTLTSDRLSEKGAIDPEVEEEGCILTARRDQNKSYYNKIIGASKLRDLLSSHQKTNGKGIHMLWMTSQMEV